MSGEFMVSGEFMSGSTLCAPYPTFGDFCRGLVWEAADLANRVANGYLSSRARTLLRTNARTRPASCAVEIKIDDIFAALMLSLIMMRRIEVKAAEPSQNPAVEPARFAAWKALALRAYNQVAAACVAKVVLSVAWFAAGMKLGVGFPWFQVGGLLIFLGWAVALIWAWKIGTDARQMRLSLGIQLRRRASTTRASGP